jgi:hypothetical protein
VIGLLPAGDRLRDYLTELPADQWAVLCFDRKTRRIDLRVQNRRLAVRLSDTTSGLSDAQLPPPYSPGIPATQPGEAGFAPGQPVAPEAAGRDFGSGTGLAVGMSQDGLLRLVRGRLRETLSRLDRAEWAVERFDRKTRRADLRVQNRRLSVTV